MTAVMVPCLCTMSLAPLTCLTYTLILKSRLQSGEVLIVTAPLWKSTTWWTSLVIRVRRPEALGKWVSWQYPVSAVLRCPTTSRVMTLVPTLLTSVRLHRCCPVTGSMTRSRSGSQLPPTAVHVVR